MSCFCPTCESEIPTGELLKEHHKSQHGEEVSGLIKGICPSCGDSRDRYRGRIPRTEGYCRDCFDGVMSGWKGENNPNWRGGMIEKKCEYCDENFESYESEGRVYCSKCWSDYSKEIHSGTKKNPNWTEREDVVCSECGEIMNIPQYRPKPNYCGDCFDGKRGKIWGGENSPLYQGGTTDYFGPNWKEQRKKALERDNFECVICGMANEIHKEEFNQSIHVHHIRPRKEFVEDGEFDYTEANKIDNLISLCNSHHRSVESNLE